MSHCPEARELLPGYVEGELTAAERTRVAGHLELCRACRQEEAQYRAAFGLLHSPRHIEAPGDLYAGFAAKLARYERAAHRPRFSLQWAAAAACLLLVVGASASYFAVHARQAEPQHTVMAPLPAPIIAPQVTRKPDSGAPGRGKPVVTQDTLPPVPDPFQAVPSAPQKLARKTGEAGMATLDGGTKGAEPRVRHRIASHSDRQEHRRQAGSLTDVEQFRRVRPKVGNSVYDREREREVATTVGGSDVLYPVPVDGNHVAPSVPLTDGNRMPGVSVVLPVREEKVRIGDSVTNVSTSAGFDARGRRVLVRVNIGTAERPDAHPGAVD